MFIVKLAIIVLSIINGKFQWSEPPRAPEPIQEVTPAPTSENPNPQPTFIEEQVWVHSEGEEAAKYGDFNVVEYVDSQGVKALVPDVDTGNPEDNWKLFWELNPEILKKVENNKGYPTPVSSPLTEN